ncbi:hypothetical protein BDZ97DRAFT_1756926 [Flammula alnicola]|nr:hypothetical protein BDZ97DRAFT_1756926 [Flammula alnicola]
MVGWKKLNTLVINWGTCRRFPPSTPSPSSVRIEVRPSRVSAPPDTVRQAFHQAVEKLDAAYSYSSKASLGSAFTVCDSGALQALKVLFFFDLGWEWDLLATRRAREHEKKRRMNKDTRPSFRFGADDGDVNRPELEVGICLFRKLLFVEMANFSLSARCGYDSQQVVTHLARSLLRLLVIPPLCGSFSTVCPGFVFTNALVFLDVHIGCCLLAVAHAHWCPPAGPLLFASHCDKGDASLNEWVTAIQETDGDNRGRSSHFRTSAGSTALLPSTFKPDMWEQERDKGDEKAASVAGECEEGDPADTQFPVIANNIAAAHYDPHDTSSLASVTYRMMTTTTMTRKGSSEIRCHLGVILTFHPRRRRRLASNRNSPQLSAALATLHSPLITSLSRHARPTSNVSTTLSALTGPPFTHDSGSYAKAKRQPHSRPPLLFLSIVSQAENQPTPRPHSSASSFHNPTGMQRKSRDFCFFLFFLKCKGYKYIPLENKFYYMNYGVVQASQEVKFSDPYPYPSKPVPVPHGYGFTRVRVRGTDRWDVGKTDLADAPRTSIDVRATICEGLCSAPNEDNARLQTMSGDRHCSDCWARPSQVKHHRSSVDIVNVVVLRRESGMLCAYYREAVSTVTYLQPLSRCALLNCHHTTCRGSEIVVVVVVGWGRGWVRGVPSGTLIPPSWVRVQWGYRFSYPYPYPRLPVAHTRAGFHTRVDH